MSMHMYYKKLVYAMLQNANENTGLASDARCCMYYLHDSSAGEVCVQCSKQKVLVASLKLSVLRQCMRFLKECIPVVTSILHSHTDYAFKQQPLRLPPRTAQVDRAHEQKHSTTNVGVS
eukprot:20846-Heterococcus_DN1.PRE.3